MLYCPRCKHKLKIVCNPYKKANELYCEHCFNRTTKYIDGCQKCDKISKHNILGLSNEKNVYSPLCNKHFDEFVNMDTNEKNKYIEFNVISYD